MSDFIEVISIAGKNYYFSFSKISTPGGSKFFVSTIENNDVVSFEIKGDEYDNWKIIEPAPKWIMKIEKTLLEIIHLHLKSSNPDIT